MFFWFQSELIETALRREYYPAIFHGLFDSVIARFKVIPGGLAVFTGCPWFTHLFPCVFAIGHFSEKGENPSCQRGLVSVVQLQYGDRTVNRVRLVCFEFVSEYQSFIL